MQVLCSLENHAGKKINLFSSHRSNERCENCWFVRKCKERRHRIKKLNLPSRLTFTLKVKPRTNKSHQTIFATRQKKPLPLLKKKKKRRNRRKEEKSRPSLYERKFTKNLESAIFLHIINDKVPFTSAWFLRWWAKSSVKREEKDDRYEDITRRLCLCVFASVRREVRPVSGSWKCHACRDERLSLFWRHGNHASSLWPVLSPFTPDCRVN